MNIWKDQNMDSSFSRQRKPLYVEDIVRLANHVAVWRQSEVSIDFWKVLGHEGLISPECLLNQPKATCVCISSINQSDRSISFRKLSLFCSRVFISRSYENLSKNTVNTEAVAHLKGLPHAICYYLLKMDKLSLRINWFPKTMVQFCFIFF